MSLLASALIGAGSSLLGNLFNNKFSRKNQDDAQDFNSREAALNRDFQERMNLQNNQFNARQAELAREWQEDFYNKYQSPSAMMAQYQAAGINPSLVAGGTTPGAVSSSSASSAASPSGSTASSGIASAVGMSLVSDIAAIMKIKAEMNEIESRTNFNNTSSALNVANTDKVNIENSYSPRLFEQNLKRGEIDIENIQEGIKLVQSNIKKNEDDLLTNASTRNLISNQANEIVARTSKTQIEAATERLKQQNLSISNQHLAQQIITEQYKQYLISAQRACEDAKAKNYTADSFRKELDNFFYKETGFSPDQTLWSILTQSLGNTSIGISSGINSFLNFFK